MKKSALTCAALAALLSVSAHAAGPLYLNDNPRTLQPLRWDTSKGPVKVFTDIGTYTYNTNGTEFVSNATADATTKFALDQWSRVPTSTWRADTSNIVKFNAVPSIGGNVAGRGAMLTTAAVRTLQPGEVGPEAVYERFNGGGMYVVYDTDGSVLETYFGVPRNQVLGIAFPEWADDNDGDGYPETITEATALMNGWFVYTTDPTLTRQAGVFTHEFGHAINLSHSQVNGPLAFSGTPQAPRYAGVKGCVPGHVRWDYPVASAGGNPVFNPQYIETMYPFLNTGTVVGGRSAATEMSTVDQADDIAAISNLYPTPAYLATTGSITGVLRLKDGRTPYSGVNIVARNVQNPLGDAVSAMTGDQTQGQLGPDGRFTIRNLKPGQQYWLYMEQIEAGGYPTTPQRLVSEGEYWNVGESSNPATDTPCTMSPITAQAGTAVQADLTFNGYAQGVQYTPIVNAQLVDLAKNGQRAAGVLGSTAFLWDAAKGFTVLPSVVSAANGQPLSRDGKTLLTQYDFNGNGILSPALWNSTTNRLTDLGSLNGDTCGSSGTSGKVNSSAWAMDDSGTMAVGFGYKDADGNGTCNSSFKGEILPFLWTARSGMKQLSTAGLDLTKLQYVRAHAISGNGRVILGAAPASQVALAWVDQGAPINLTTTAKDANGVLWDVNEAYAASRDGSRVALSTRKRGMVFWNPYMGTGPAAFTPMPTGLKWCVDLPYSHPLQGNLCLKGQTHETIQAVQGDPFVISADMSDDGRMVVARAGSTTSGFLGMFWLEGAGWFRFDEFFRKQGVAEAYALGIQNPLAVNGAGNEVVGGLPGIQASWYVDMKQAFVCQGGSSVQVGFPNGFVDALKAGAKAGRCEHL